LGRINMPLVVVPDVLAGLVALGEAARARSQAKVIAVTGSAGKTSTKEALRLALAPSGKVHASDKSFNNHWGVPLTLSRMPQDTDFAVFEIGMNHAGEIRPLVKMVRPHVAIVTLIAAAHLGHFNNLEEITQAKAEIFEGVEPGGTALLNRDDLHSLILTKLAREAGVEHVATFGQHEKATYHLVSCELQGDHSDIVVRVADRSVSLRLGAPGRHIVQNALAVLGAAHLTGADVDKAAAALANLVPEQGRGLRHRLMHPAGEFVLIDESYNANPASMRAAIELLSATEVGEGGRRVAVLGDMLELGVHARRLHVEIAGVLKKSKVDMLYLGGPEMRALADTLPEGMAAEYRQTVAELEPALIEGVRAGDAVMVKSSKGIGFSKLVDALTRKYPAVQQASEPT
ncbi:MAG: UDP-N-acetylmuramoyl-tripeptide--D-alanyl-D-alanine ligase, partial [Rhizobiaceae bacterium]|nr:UDP-N-acetylmuramoyl-tripeptide--D-alanyl-D-alanine ligase [Rhizobiaceae bacterium]